MTVLPEACPLDDPPGRPDAVLETAGDARAAARLLADLADDVATARVPAWTGEDARTVGERAARVAGLAAGTAEALLRAAARLVEHAEVWQAVRARTAALRSEQDRERAAAGARVAVPLDPLDPLAPPVDDVLSALARAEQRRAAEHAALLGVLEDDAADTGRVLRACSATVGGVGGRGRHGRAVAHLAALLPAWAATELAARGHALADVLAHGPGEGAEAAAADALSLADAPVFASALLGGLGVERLRLVLLDLDHVGLGEGSAVARVLSAALGAVPGHRSGRVSEVLGARYVDSRDASTVPDQIARGLAVVVLTGARYGRLPAAATLGRWARQVALREAAVGPLADRLGFLADRADADPLADLLGVIASRADAGAAAELLSDRAVWAHLLARPWDDGGRSLAGVVASLRGAPDPVAQVALRAGLQALGEGLQDGSPDGWTVARSTAEAVAPGMAGALAAHVETITGLLAGVAGSCPPPDRLAALHGLGLVTTAPGAAPVVAAGLRRWSGTPRPAALTASGDPVLLAVPAAFLAVRHHGQRLAHALDSHEDRREAELGQRRWDATAGLLVEGLLGRYTKGSPVADAGVGAIETAAQGLVGADGRWSRREDEGRRFTAGDASRAVAAGPGDRGEDGLRRAAGVAADVFVRAQAALGEPHVALPREGSIATDVRDALLDADPRRGPAGGGGRRSDVRSARPPAEGGVGAGG